MAILNYTTKVSVDKTIAELQKILAKAKAKMILCEYSDTGEIEALSFKIDVKGQHISFRLPARVDAVYKALCSDAPPRFHDMDQAKRVCWRIIKDWVEAQMALVNIGMAEMAEVFLPYAQQQINGEIKTLYQAIQDNGFKQLSMGTPPA